MASRSSTTLGFAAMSIIAAAALAGCSDNPPADGPDRLGGEDHGVSLRLPDGWKALDVSFDDLAAARKDAGIEGMNPAAAEAIIEQARKQNSVLAVDPDSATSNFVTNVNAFCQPDPAGETGPGLAEYLENNVAQLGFEKAQASEMTIDGKDAVRLSYQLATADNELDGMQFYVPASDERVCIVTVTAPRGELPDEAEQIGTSIRTY